MSNEKKETKREKFAINVAEHEPFEATAETKYITSNEFCKIVSELFKNVFADYEGCTFDVGNAGEPTISLLFNHGQYSDDDTVACHLRDAKDSDGSSVIRNMRRRDIQLREGDRYHLTEDGKDVIMDLLTPRAFNGGKPNWGSIVQDIIDRNPTTYYMPASQIPQYTRVSFIDIKRLCGLIYGRDVEDDQKDYQVTIASPLNQMSYAMGGMPTGATNYVLSITRASLKEVTKMYEKLGYGNMMGTNIVR